MIRSAAAFLRALLALNRERIGATRQGADWL
jgi:hypothetical protein